MTDKVFEKLDLLEVYIILPVTLISRIWWKQCVQHLILSPILSWISVYLLSCSKMLILLQMLLFFIPWYFFPPLNTSVINPWTDTLITSLKIYANLVPSNKKSCISKHCITSTLNVNNTIFEVYKCLGQGLCKTKDQFEVFLTLKRQSPYPLYCLYIELSYHCTDILNFYQRKAT